MIKAVLFDFGGTLFDYSPSNYSLLGSISRKYGKDIKDTDPFLSVIFQHQEEMMISILKHHDRLTDSDWIKLDKLLLEELGIDSPKALDEIVARFKEREFKFEIYTETMDVLRHLSKNGFKLGIITNLRGDTQISHRYELLEERGMLDLFEAITISGEIGLSKPDPEIFLKSVERMGGIEAYESLFIGDSYYFDILGAKSAGMVPVLLDPNLGTDHDCLKVSSIGGIIGVINGLNDGKGPQ